MIQAERYIHDKNILLDIFKVNSYSGFNFFLYSSKQPRPSIPNLGRDSRALTDLSNMSLSFRHEDIRRTVLGFSRIRTNGLLYQVERVSGLGR